MKHKITEAISYVNHSMLVPKTDLRSSGLHRQAKVPELTKPSHWSSTHFFHLIFAKRPRSDPQTFLSSDTKAMELRDEYRDYLVKRFHNLDEKIGIEEG